MKANETPEKLYVSSKQRPDREIFYGTCTKVEDDDIEYTRTDAFIENAKKWFEKRNEWINIDGTRQCDMESFEDFKKYMIGE